MEVIEIRRRIGDRIGSEDGMRLNVPGLTVSDVNKRFTRVDLVGMVIENGGIIDGPVDAERPHALVPMDVSGARKLDASMFDTCLAHPAV